MSYCREISVDLAEIFEEEEFQNLTKDVGDVRKIELIAENGPFFSYISNISLRLKYDSQKIGFFLLISYVK